MSQENRCEACLEIISEHYVTCPYCGTDLESVDYLKSQGLDPWGVYEILRGRVNFFRLTISIAKMVADILRTKHDKPN